ncbi:RNA-directed DNA polymerase from mobile element jockey [Trichonephila clavipes]|nr:RNA-directed DNA polymerase from mobile element jockey [Trichonephila clavipes]
MKNYRTKAPMPSSICKSETARMHLKFTILQNYSAPASKSNPSIAGTKLTNAGSVKDGFTLRNKDARINAGLLKDLLVIIEDTPCIDKQVFCRAFKNSLSLRSARHLQQLSTNWYNFKFALNKKPIPTTDLTSNENIELAISELNQKLSEAFVEASKPKFKNAPKILSPEIKSKIHQRNRLRKFWQRTRCPSIYTEFRTLSREIAKDIQSHSRTQWEKHIEALSPEDNTLWRKSSLLRKPFRSIPPLQGALGSTAITPIEKTEVVADSLQEQFEPNHVAGREEFDQRIHAEVENFLAIPHVQEIEPTTPTEVLTYVQRIKPQKKSPGLDQISNRMIKNLPLNSLLIITLLINQLFKKNYFPDSWKTAVVIPILKPDKNPELAQNYRPISLLSSLSKVYEFVLLRRLNLNTALLLI